MTNQRHASLYQSQNPGCTKLIWSPPHFHWHHKNSEKKRRGNPFLGKIEIDLIGQIYQSGTDMSPHNSFLRHISSQGRNLETFIEMVNFPNKRWKNAFKHTHCKWLSNGANFQGAKIQDCDCYMHCNTVTRTSQLLPVEIHKQGSTGPHLFTFSFRIAQAENTCKQGDNPFTLIRISGYSSLSQRVRQ